MPFKYKLSRRLAVLRAACAVASVSFVCACETIVGSTPQEDLQLSLSPKLLVLQPSEEGRFSVKAGVPGEDSAATDLKGTLGHLYSNATKSLGLEWAATGGSIASDGRYTAAAEPGEYRVIVSSQLGKMADTARVVVAAPPPALVGVSLAPESTTVDVGAAVQFSVVGIDAAGGNVGVAAAFSASGGSVDAAGLYTSPGAPGSYEVIALVEDAAGTFADTSVVVVVVPPPSLATVRLSPDSTSVEAGASVQFSVVGIDAAGSDVVVAASFSASGGSVDAGGRYVAPDGAGSYEVIARVQNAAGLFADTSVVVVIPAPSVLAGIVLSPGSATIEEGASVGFSVVGHTDAGESVAIAVAYSAFGGSIDAAGLYTATAGPGTFPVIARHEGADGVFADTSLVNVIPAPSVLAGIVLSPESAAIDEGASVEFSVIGHTDAGESVAVTAAYSASGGSIDAGGLYTASAGPGTFQVIARHEGADGVFADTSVVTVSSSPAAEASIALDELSGHNGRNLSRLIWSHRIGGGDNRLLVVGFGVEHTGEVVVTGVSYAGVAMTRVEAAAANSGGTNQLVQLWYLLDAKLPDAGDHQVAITANAAVDEFNVGAISLVNVAQRAPGATAVNTAWNSAEMATTITTRSDRMWVIDAVGSGGGGIWTAGSGQALRWSESAGNASAAGSTRFVASAGAVTMRHTHSPPSNRTAHVVMAVAPAGSPEPPPPPTPVASVVVAPATAALSPGDRQQFAASTRDASGNALAGRSVTWNSSNPAVASVNESGLVTAVAFGQATITASSEGKQGAASVGVASDPTVVASVTVIPSSAGLWVGATRQFTAEPKNEAGVPLGGHAITWSSADPAVATVSSSGVVRGVAEGTATITARASGVEGRAQVNVMVPGQEPEPWFEEDFSRYRSDAEFRGARFSGSNENATATSFYDSDYEWQHLGSYKLDQTEGVDVLGLTQSMKTTFNGGGCGPEPHVGRRLAFPDHQNWSREMWLEIYFKFSSNFKTTWGCGGSAGLKWLHYSTTTSQKKWSNNHGLTSGGPGARWGMEIGDNPSGENVKIDAPLSSEFWDGQWHRFRVHVKIDGENSLMSLWLDDQFVRKIVARGAGTKFSGLTLGANSNNQPGAQISYWWGRIRAWTVNPGWTGEP